MVQQCAALSRTWQRCPHTVHELHFPCTLLRSAAQFIWRARQGSLRRSKECFQNGSRQRPSPRQRDLLVVADFKLLLIVFAAVTQRQPDPSRAACFSRCRSHIKLNAQLIPSRRALKCHISAWCIILTQASHSLPDEGIFSACARLLVCLSAGLWRLCTNPRTKERRSVRI